MPRLSSNTKRQLAIEALAQENNKSRAARISGYSRTHLHKLLKDPSFAAAVDARRAELGPSCSPGSDAVTPAGRNEDPVTAPAPSGHQAGEHPPEHLEADRNLALETLRSIARNKKAPKGPRVAAAKALLRASDWVPMRVVAPATRDAEPVGEPSLPTSEPTPVDGRGVLRRLRLA